MRWFLHPQGEQQQQRLEFYLNSLVTTGELNMNGHKYVVTGQALRAIEEYEEQERKHTESVKMQWRMFWVALAVVALTGVQAGLVKLPTLLDLSNSRPEGRACINDVVLDVPPQHQELDVWISDTGNDFRCREYVAKGVSEETILAIALNQERSPSTPSRRPTT